jgi:UDP-glucose 4-epimerase
MGKPGLSYQGARVLVLGGAGFLGRNVADAARAAGSVVTSADLKSADVSADITDAEAMNRLVQNHDFIFNMAGLSGAVDSNQNPLRHMQVNCGGHLNVLEACRAHNPTVRIFFPSSQLVYGHVDGEPVRETHATNPTSVYGVHKLALEHHYRLYHHLYGLRTSMLRISNPYGPGQPAELPYGIVNNFVMKALRGETIEIFGEGTQIRDYVYIDDVVSAILLVAACEPAYGKVYNCGGNDMVALIDMAEMVVGSAGSGTIDKIAWPEDAKKAEVGNMFLDKKLIRETLDWSAEVPLSRGIKKTVDYYRTMVS